MSRVQRENSHKQCERVPEMSPVAAEAQRLVYTAAEPVPAGLSVKGQVRRAYDRLRARELKAGWSKIVNAWQGRAGAPTLVALQRQARKVGLAVEPVAALLEPSTAQQLANLAEALNEIDPDFYQPSIGALREVLRVHGRAAGESGPETEGEA